MSELFDFVWLLACIVGIMLLIAAALAPIESLRWWAGWSQRPAPEAPLEKTQAPASHNANAYVVYMSGIAAMDPEGMERKENFFLERLRAQMPDAAIISDVFPYSVTNNPLTGERVLARFWAWAKTSRLKRTSILNWLALFLPQIRNILQIAVSADTRYGPIYNFGVAKEVTEALMRSGYQFGSDAPVILLGYSGGGQISVGAAPYLKKILERPVWVIGIGGFYTDDAGILDVAHLYRLSSPIDWIQNLGVFLYAGRWRLLSYSAWNRAQRAGKISVVNVGRMAHTGKGDYMSRSSKLPDGTSHAEKMAQDIDRVVHEIVSSAALAHA